MNGRTLFVDERSKNEIDALRMQEYARASGFAVDLTTLKWRQSDSESFVMAAEAQGQLISTMRGEVIDELSLLEKKLECPWSYALPLDFPVLLLSRAATLSSHRSAGLNLVLRYWFLKLAQHHAIPFVIGTFVSGSPREQTLREMGYQFFENPQGWQQSTYRSLRPVCVVALDMRKHGQQALAYCESRVAAGIEQFQFDGGFPALRKVRTI
jgi:hypothetical protein